MTARTVVVVGSLVLAIVGWASTVGLWLFGHVGAASPAFDVARLIAATFTVTFAVAYVMPDKARMHALGVIEGIRLAQAAQGGGDPAPETEKRHLRVM